MKGSEMGFFNRRIILILLSFFVAFLVFYSLVLYPQQKTKENRRKAKVARLNTEIESAQKVLEKERARVQEILNKRLDFNFMIAEQRPFKQRLSSLLEEIQRISSNYGIVIQKIEPMKEEEFETYTKYPLTMDFISDFRGFVQFIRHVEEDLNLNLGEFSVEREKGQEGKLLARCIINAYELKGMGIIDIAKFQKGGIKKEKDLSSIQIKRDPFQRPGMEKKAVAFHETYRLQGIIKWGKSYQAIIDNKEYKAGDRLGERTIVDIKEDRVVFEGNTPPLVIQRRVEK